MFPDFKELLQSFHDHNVKYLIVGGSESAEIHSLPVTSNLAPIPKPRNDRRGAGLL
jgi:hypothetical protein